MTTATLCISVFLLATMVPDLSLGQASLPPEIIAVDPKDGAMCPTDEQIQNTLGTIQEKVRGELEKLYPCGDPRVWREVISVNMTDTSHSCPTGLTLFEDGDVRGCGRTDSNGQSCTSATFAISGGEYSKVCGRIRGYQFGETSAFNGHDQGFGIDEQYLDGVSLTHGPDKGREHIWSYASGRTEDSSSQFFPDNVCPCDIPLSENPKAPSFVGDSYFCESGAATYGEDLDPQLFPDDLLWDGDGCSAESRCCDLNTPYFTKQLDAATTDDIELRLCLGGAGAGDKGSAEADIPLELIQLYVQ